jgi:hypothetical protein
MNSTTNLISVLQDKGHLKILLKGQPGAHSSHLHMVRGKGLTTLGLMCTTFPAFMKDVVYHTLYFNYNLSKVVLIYCYICIGNLLTTIIFFNKDLSRKHPSNATTLILNF